MDPKRRAKKSPPPSPRRPGATRRRSKASAPPQEVDRLNHELQVHQEELEIQNRQLIESQRMLEESRDRYATLYDFAPVPYVTFCDHGVIRDINLPGAELLGHSRDRLVDRPFVLFVTNPYRRLFLAHLSRCRNGKRPLSTELVLRGGDGRELPIEMRTSQGTIQAEERDNYLSVLIDLTDRRRLEQERDQLVAAKSSERLLRTILQTLPIAVRVAGAGGESLMFNEACRAVWGIPTGAPLPPWNHQQGWDVQTRRPLAVDEWPVARALHGSPGVLSQMIQVQGFDGTTRQVLQSAVPLLDHAGSTIGAVEVTEDVTRLSAAQDVARRRQEQLEAAFDAAHLSFWDWNVATDHITWSGPFEQIFAPGGSASPATQLARRLHPDDVEPMHRAIEESKNHRTPFEEECRVIYPRGAVHWIAAKGRFAYRSGQPVRMTGVVTDITARKQSEADLRQAKEAAEQASRLKDDFLATVSHELRTPLSAILLWAHLARSTFSSVAEKDEALDIIVVNAKAQSQLVNDLLDISRGIAGKLRLNLQTGELAAPLRAALDSVRPSAEARRIVLEEQFAADAPIMPIDPDRIQQVAWNLLSNAIKFTPPDGTVTVRLETTLADGAKPIARLSVIDTGQGIPAELLPHIFDRFRQGESGITRMFGGLGLGLAIARELVQMHGGTIRADSPGPGKGATFTVELPLPAVAIQPPHPAAPLEKADSLQGMRILLVEDDLDTCEALARLLESAGANVNTAHTADAALDAFTEIKPDVLVSDIAMPVEDGYSLLRRVREVESHVRPRRSRSITRNSAIHGTPALALTAHARPEDRDRAMAAGFHAHLAKPVDPKLLISTIVTIKHGNGVG
ncbi:MAG TPA: ATP-binding protein [Tepidisphaeraceae bacterium]|jgi:PAS domain S-box-containing protein|nr:ATP-binding protein [Tepidisphaeraceae bacterium]